MMMRKRERENPCGVCGHYHKYEEGEVCGICGHRMPESTADKSPSVHLSAFPSQILPDFLFLGSYDNASRSELLKTQGITRVLNVINIYIFALNTENKLIGFLFLFFCRKMAQLSYFGFKFLWFRV